MKLKEMYSAFAVIVNYAVGSPHGGDDDMEWGIVPFFGHLDDAQRLRAVNQLITLARDVLLQPGNNPYNRDFWKKVVEEELAKVEAITFDPVEEAAA